MTTLFLKHGLEECQNILETLDSYLILQDELMYAFAPPILTPNDMDSLELIAKVQEHTNEWNVRRGTAPLFPFRWVMRMQPASNKLVHVSSNWLTGSSTLTMKGSRKYFQAIWKYLQSSFTAVLHNYDLTSRILDPSEIGSNGMRNNSYADAAPVQGRHQRRTNRRDGHDPSNRRENLCLRTRTIARARVNSGRIDLRLRLCARRISREINLLERLAALNGTRVPRELMNITQNHIM